MHTYFAKGHGRVKGSLSETMGWWSRRDRFQFRFKAENDEAAKNHMEKALKKYEDTKLVTLVRLEPISLA